MSQNESTPFLVTDAKKSTLIDATRENSPWCLLPHWVELGNSAQLKFLQAMNLQVRPQEWYYFLKEPADRISWDREELTD